MNTISSDDDKLIFNDNYMLRYDSRRFELLGEVTHDVFKDFDAGNTVDDVHMPLHPLLALLFLHFDGKRSVGKVIRDYANLTGFSKNYIAGFVKKMIAELYGKEEGKYLQFDGYSFYLPKNLFLKNNGKRLERKINIKDFLIPKDKLDFDSYRSYIPSDCFLEINFKCYTDCVYCYADRREKRDCTIPIERLKEIIREARALEMRTFDLSGGEFFLYEKWEILLGELLDNGFNPYISTKVPIGEETIKKIKDFGIEGIQLSIDSIDRNELKRLLIVGDDYKEKILKTLETLDKEGIKIAINSQITSINDDMGNIKKMLEYFLKLQNIKSIKLGAAGRSIYKSAENYEQIAPSLDKILEIKDFFESHKDKNQNISMSFSGFATADLLEKKSEEKTKVFDERARCSGNFYAFVILPDGRVTVCEELYFHPQFIIGDLMTQSIEEVWNSERALELYHFSKEMTRKESACHTCDDFDNCHKLKGICWKEVLYAYGPENWDYPDPRCPIAPKPHRTYWLT